MLMTKTALTAVLALGTCTGLPPGDMTTPQYWGDYMLDKYAQERHDATVNIEPGPTPLAQPRTVLLITGVTIPAEWFDPIVLRLERDGFRPVVYEPPALLSGDLFENSQLLADKVDEIRAQTGEEKIDILAECTGGLIARHYIQSLGGDEHVSRMITFISPQHGLPKAATAYAFAGWDALNDLTPGSAFLTAVNSAPLPQNVPVTSIYTCSDEYIQPYETSIIPGAKNIGLGCDKFVGHFQFFYDPEIYNVMHAELVAPVPGDDASDDDASDDDASDDGSDGSEADDAPDAGGCTASGPSTGHGALIILGALVAIRRRRRT